MVLFYRQADLGLRKFFTSGGPDRGTLELVYGTVAAAPEPLTAAEIAERSGLKRRRVQRAVSLLDEARALHIAGSSAPPAWDVTATASGERVASAVDRALHILEQRRHLAERAVIHREQPC